jgi:hypothetical protein
MQFQLLNVGCEVASNVRPPVKMADSQPKGAVRGGKIAGAE